MVLSGSTGRVESSSIISLEIRNWGVGKLWEGDMYRETDGSQRYVWVAIVNGW